MEIGRAMFIEEGSDSFEERELFFEEITEEENSHSQENNKSELRVMPNTVLSNEEVLLQLQTTIDPAQTEVDIDPPEIQHHDQQIPEIRRS